MNSMFGYTASLSLTANERKSTSILIDSDSDFLVEKIYMNSNGDSDDGAFKLQVTDSTSSHQWFSQRIRGENFFGTAQYPNKLPYQIPLRRNTRLDFDIEDLSGAANEIEIVFEGYRLYQPINIDPKKKFFCYVQDMTVSAVSIYQEVMNIAADTDFLINRFIAYQSADYSGKMKMSFSSMSQRALYSQFTYIDNIFGTALKPNDLTHPIRLDKNSLVKFEVQNTTAAEKSYQFVFDGIKIWG